MKKEREKKRSHLSGGELLARLFFFSVHPYVYFLSLDHRGSYIRPVRSCVYSLLFRLRQCHRRQRETNDDDDGYSSGSKARKLPIKMVYLYIPDAELHRFKAFYIHVFLFCFFVYLFTFLSLFCLSIFLSRRGTAILNTICIPI